ncbi:hypothetical protein ACS5NO_12660 [Larkinella sp. GY13]|uniref:hypothetical protein n=1 Tax=Larkinella sp. GY13 TaxID=3453720 RepID=UPI003EEFF6E0
MKVKTKIYLWSMDGSVEIGKSLKFAEFIEQIEAYFNQFGHLPKIGDLVKPDPDSDTISDVIAVDRIEYGGIDDESFVISISLKVE